MDLLKKIGCYRLLITISFFFIGNLLVAQAYSDSSEIVELKSQLAELKAVEQNGLSWQDYLGVGAILTALFSLFWYLVRSALNNKVSGLEQQFEAKIIKTINDKKDIIDLTIEKTDKEQKLLETKKIFIWGEDDYSLTKRVLKNAGFNFENLFTSETEAIEKGFDILFINNQKGTLQMTEMLDKIETLNSKQLAFYFNTSRVRLQTEDLKTGKEDKVNFSTNASQIYGNLLNSLKYQDKIRNLA